MSIGCLNCPPDTRKIARTRGVCPNCCNVLQALVQKGTTTWDKLMAAGKCVASKKPRERGYNSSKRK